MVLLKRKTMWEEISSHGRDNFLLIGDFNQLESSDQKFRGSDYCIPVVTCFRQWRFDNCVLDIHTIGNPYTWTNKRKHQLLLHEARQWYSSYKKKRDIKWDEIIDSMEGIQCQVYPQASNDVVMTHLHSLEDEAQFVMGVLETTDEKSVG
ncbi:hypothetical protein BVRB_9g225530 [Beta vulgaris subsp. vulgaris]|uniref:Endonuclease/exonuclease/phosphatase domain-containing protein n=1 Tax=Beta vulgaris subsp. vulgaris TaxID=3555 RepID=A0A0J8B8U0_BETVV|nr:hypothetical protein BVRB_9g225530 [Beta vulgaris subsp. vulgaris]